MSEQSNTAEAAGSFRQEFEACWREVPDKAWFFGMLAAWCLLFHFLGNSTFGYTDTPSLFLWMHNAYNAPGSDDGHGNLIPFVVAGLFWWKRKELLAVPRQAWWPALALLAGAVLLHLAGYLVQQPRLSIVAFFAGAYSLMGLVWGWRWMRASFFPFALFAFCVPLGSLAESITFPLRMAVTHISVALGQGLGIEVIRDGSRIFNAQQTFQYDVAPACSGIRSLISLLALTTIYGFVSFQQSWKRILMVALAIPLAVAGNVFRITGVIVTGEAFGQDAGAFVEQKLGFVTFLVALALVFAVGFILRERRAEPIQREVAA